MPGGQPLRDDLLRSLRQSLRAGRCRMPAVWITFMGLGGEADEFDLDAYIHGLGPLTAFDEMVIVQTCLEIRLS